MALSQENKEFFQKYLNKATTNQLIELLETLPDSAVNKVKSFIKGKIVARETAKKESAEGILQELS